MIVAQERSYHYSLPEETRRPVRRPRSKHMPGKGKLALLGLVLLGFCTGILIAFFYAQMMSTGYHIYRLEKDLAVVSQETQGLSERISRLSSLERVESVATGKLGMVKPDNSNIVMVAADLNLGETGAGSSSASGGDSIGLASNTPSSAGGKVSEDKDQGKRNWVIQAFTDLVGQLEGRIRAS